MGMLMKNLIAGAVVGSLALTGAVLAQDEERQVRHKIIEIKSKKDDVDVSVKVNDDNHALFFTRDELADENVIYDKLSHLDDDTRETVLEALQNIKIVGEDGIHLSNEDSFIVNKGIGQQFVVLSDDHDDQDVEFEFVHDGKHKKIQKHFIFGGTDGVLKGHTNAIVKMIERGEFNQEELDKIQAAVDSKR